MLVFKGESGLVRDHNDRAKDGEDREFLFTVASHSVTPCISEHIGEEVNVGPPEKDKEEDDVGDCVQDLDLNLEVEE